MVNSRICAYVAGCPIYAYFDRNAMREYMTRFCLGQYENCQRRALRTADRHVPQELLPDGRMLAELEHERRMSDHTSRTHTVT